MKNNYHSFTGNINLKHRGPRKAEPMAKESTWGPKPATPSGIRTTARDYANPVDYQHPYPSMSRYGDFLALRYDANRTRHAYYRHLRLIHEHLACDPATITEAQLRDYFLFVKLQKHWKPKTIRQALAAAKMFFIELLGQPGWTVFSQIRTKDHDTLPAVLTAVHRGWECFGVRRGFGRARPSVSACSVTPLRPIMVDLLVELEGGVG